MLDIRRILVPVDFSSHCARAVAYGREFAAIHSARLDVLQVVEEPMLPSMQKVGEEVLYGRVPDARVRALDALRECVDESDGSGLDEEVGYHVENGKAGEKIVEVAGEHDTDLIVIATHGLTGLERVLVGSVAEQVIRNAPCPVFVIKSYGKSIL